MNKSLREVLRGEHNNHILPLFWMCGEEEQVLREEMGKVHACGIRAVCLESRPHPDYAGPSWFKDVDIIMDEAKKRGMRVWIFDDSHFPTGYANGWIKDKYPEKGKVYLNEKHIDAMGPMKGGTFAIGKYLGSSAMMSDSNAASLEESDQLLAVIAARRLEKGEELEGSFVNLTPLMYSGVVEWDVPDGAWRIFILYQTRKGGGYEDYINPIDKESVRVLIDAVYEPHYKQYKEEFGGTFAGFFTDEPGIGNAKGYQFNESIGRKKMALPWSVELPKLLEEKLGKDFYCYLPCLWYEGGEKTSLTRYSFMNIITNLYDQCFTTQLGDWCRNHGVEYIGHVIEDNNVHARLGVGPGHFFRALYGQDMSGIDVVLNQIIPGFDAYDHNLFNNSWDGEFFHYALAKMGSSLGHIQPAKAGRTLCEIFGAFGWSEGLKLMKWLTDHMLVRGVNYFVPHAFSPKEYPDFDCPPHFYAKGRNPQYRYFGYLMDYMNRMSHLLNGGIHIAPVALLYHAEAEWSGNYMLLQKPARLLTRGQIDFDVLPSDVFEKPQVFGTRFESKELLVNKERYRVLVVPYSQYITEAVANAIIDAEEQGFMTVFIEQYPEGISDLQDEVAMELVMKLKKSQCVKEAALISYLRLKSVQEIQTSEEQLYLRYYHYKKSDSEFFMFFNEDPLKTISTQVTLPFTGDVSVYNAFENNLETVAVTQIDNEIRLPIKLSPYESVVIVLGQVDADCLAEPYVNLNDSKIHEAIERINPWKLTYATSEQYPIFWDEMVIDELCNISSMHMKPEFSGTIRYETCFNVSDRSFTCIDLGDVYETAQLWINNEKIGIRIAPPYVFDIRGKIMHGINTLKIEVTNTLGIEQKDIFSITKVLEPTGLLGPVLLKK